MILRFGDEQLLGRLLVAEANDWRSDRLLSNASGQIEPAAPDKESDATGLVSKLNKGPSRV